MSARNPFEGDGGHDTIHNVVCGLEYLSQCFDQASETRMLEDLSFGQFLILQTLAEALRGAEAQLEKEREQPVLKAQRRKKAGRDRVRARKKG